MSLSSIPTSLVRAVTWHRRAVAAVLTALAVLAAVTAMTPQRAPTVDVVVAARDVAAGSRLAAADLTTIAYPEALVPDAAVVNVGQVVGRAASVAISARTPITANALSTASSLTGPGEQLVAFRVPDASVLSLVHVGDLVSVVATTSDNTVVNLASRVRVAALPQQSEAGGLIGGSSSSGGLVVVSCPPKTAATLAGWAASTSLGITVG